MAQLCVLLLYEASHARVNDLITSYVGRAEPLEWLSDDMICTACPISAGRTVDRIFMKPTGELAIDPMRNDNFLHFTGSLLKKAILIWHVHMPPSR
jgi:hypothetical protein